MRKELELLHILKKHFLAYGVMPSKAMRKLMDDLERGEVTIVYKKEIRKIQRIVDHMLKKTPKEVWE